MITRLVRFVAGAALVAAPVAVPIVTAGPAAAATCAGAGVNVVVDFNDLGGGVQTGCDTDGGGRPASEVFPTGGFGLDYVQSVPGMVCRVAGEPASASCSRAPAADAYWSLWWTDGSSGQWTYASEGVGTLDVPSGGSVAFSWQSGDGRTPPSAAAPVRSSPRPSPTKSPTKGPTKSPTKGPTKSPTKSATNVPTKSPSASPTKSPRTTTGTASGGSSDAVGAGVDRGESSSKRNGAGDGGTAGESERAASSPVGSRSRGQDPAAEVTRSDGSSSDPTSASTFDPEEGIEPPLSSDSSDPLPANQTTSADGGDGGVPGYVLALVVLMLAGAAGGIALLRRFRSGT